MWLQSKDERVTLRKYHYYLHDVNEVVCFTGLSERAYNATHNLIERGLIYEIEANSIKCKDRVEYMSALQYDKEVNLEGFLATSETDEVAEKIMLKFTLKGLDLACKYDNWLIRSGLWFAEYKNHWIWLIVSFFGGVIGGGVLVNWLSKGFK